MEKRGLISLRGVLLRYLVQTVFCCVLALLLWFAALMCVINSGLALPANQADYAHAAVVGKVNGNGVNTVEAGAGHHACDDHE